MTSQVFCTTGREGKERRRWRSIETSFSRFPSNFPRTIHPGLNPSREVRSLNTRNICFLSNETSLLNGTQHFSLSLFFFFFSIGAFRRFRIEPLVVYYYKPLHLSLLPPFFLPPLFLFLNFICISRTSESSNPINSAEKRSISRKR